MPKIALYNSKEELRVPGGGLSTPAAFGGGTGIAGHAISQVADFFQQRAERDQVNDINTSMAKVRGEWIEHLSKKSEEAAAGAPDFTKGIVDEYDAAMEKMRSERSLPKHLADRLTAEQEQFKAQLIGRATAFEAGSRAAKRRDDAIGYKTGISRTVFNDPAMFQTELERVDDALTGFGLKGDAHAALSRDLKTDLAQNTVRGLINRGNLEGARAALKGGPISEFIDGDLASQLEKGIDQEQRRLDAEARAEADRRRGAAVAEVGVLQQDVFAAIQVNGKSPDEGRLRQAYTVAYGDKPEMAARLTAQIDNAKNFYTVSKGVAFTSPSEDAATIADLRTKASGQNAAQVAGQMATMQQVVAAKYREINADPFAYVVRNDPQIQQMLTEGAQNPEMFRRGLARANELQARLGVQEWNRSYLGATAATQMAASIASAPPEQAANEIENLRQRYGGYFPAVVAELEAAKLPPTFVTIARMDRPEDSVPRVNLAIANQVGVETLKKSIGNETRVKAVTDRVSSNIEEYAPALARQGTYASRTLAADVQSVKNLALLYVTQGESENAAADRAYNEVIGSRYDFDKTWLAPKGLGSKVRADTDAIISNLSPSDFAPEKGGDPALSEDYRRNAALQEARRNGFWINTPGGDGLILATPRGPVVKADGQPVTLLFKDVGKTPRAPLPDIGTAAP
jgi:hypothetical protein